MPFTRHARLVGSERASVQQLRQMVLCQTGSAHLAGDVIAKIEKLTDCANSKSIVLRHRQHNRDLTALSENHDRLSLRVVEDVIKTRPGFRLVDGLHNGTTLRAGASADPRWARGLA